MSHRTIDLLFNVTGQSLYFDAPEGRPSSVTSSSLYESGTGDDGTAESALTGSAAVDTNPSTTFDAASGDGTADPRKCNLTATTSVAIGRPYLATNALGEKELVEVTGIAGADYVMAREPLVNSYAAADTFVTTRVTHAVDSTWIADSSNLSHFDPNARYRWRLVYVVSSTTYVHDLGVDVLRYAGRHDVSPIDVDRRAPGWLDRLPTYYREDQGRSLIDEAYQSIKFDLYNLSTPDQAIRNREAVNELVTLKAIEALFQDERSARAYAARLEQLIAQGKVATSKSAGAAASVGDLRGIWGRR